MAWRTLAFALSILALAFAPVRAQSPAAQMRDLLERGYYNSAAQVAGPALVEGYPESPEAHFLYAKALFLVGDLGSARRELDRARMLLNGTADAEIDHLDGLLLAAEGNPSAALERLRGAYERSGSYDHAMDWGRVAWQAMRLEEALEAYSLAVETERGRRSSWPHLNRGRLLSVMGRREEAMAAFRKAIETFEEFDTGEARPSPAYVEAYFRLGEIHEAVAEETGSEREYRLAEDNYRAALTGDPNYTPAINALDRLSRRAP